jgi:gliding motility-associated-like protein
LTLLPAMASPGFKITNLNVTYKDWASATIHLTGLAGKKLRLDFTTNDCTRGGHFGYAYIDVQDHNTSPITGNVYCEGQNGINLNGPPGFAKYSWYNADMSKKVAEGQIFSTSPPPADNTTYVLQVEPFPGLGCIDTMSTTIRKSPVPFVLKVRKEVISCPGVPVDLTAPAITAGSSSDITYSYYTDSLVNYPLGNKNSIYIDGTYYIKAENSSGCIDIAPVHVTFKGPEIQVTDPPAVTYPQTVDLSTTYTPLDGLTYSYFTDAAANHALENYTEIKHSSTYYIKTSNGQCTSITPVKVYVLPPVPFTITAPNLFTPNNDGVNDNFGITVSGLLSYGSLKVYSRGGKLVFNSTESTAGWDGKINGANAPAGTYYWVFEGQDEYYTKNR